MLPPIPGKYDTVVLGAGVIGLSIALELAKRGFRPAIIAKDLPEDLLSTGFSSPWAGCNWQSFEPDGTSRQARWDTITYQRLGELSRTYPDIVKAMPFYVVWDRRVSKEEVWWSKLMPDFREVVHSPSDPVPGSYPHAHTFTSYTTNAPAYLVLLGSLVRGEGIPIIRKRVSSLDEAYSCSIPEIGRVSLVVNATGLGAGSLIGVEDGAVYAARGQTVLVRAPEVGRCVMQTIGFMKGRARRGSKSSRIESPLTRSSAPATAYIIPRPGPAHHVVLGGTYLPHDHSTQPCLSEAERILKACYDLEPLLAGKDGTSWRDIEVVSHNVGLRPAREGGVRLELEERTIGQSGSGDTERGAGLTPPTNDLRGRKVGVVHAYGFGSVGKSLRRNSGRKPNSRRGQSHGRRSQIRRYIASLGAAEEAGDLATSFRSQHSDLFAA
ncbi:hypothetical protein JCM24511_00729 [Saitozyma sp. JCM 24511]|nr:hypothetical protein JCM24511_00729 [Saitozyma sp. JCM 24511]